MRAALRLVMRIAIIALVVVGVVYAAWRLKAVIVSIVIAGILAYIIRPLASWLCRQPWFKAVHRFPRARRPQHARRTVATGYIVVLLCALTYLGARIVLTPFIAEAKHLAQSYPSLQRRFTKTSVDAQAWYERTIPPNTRNWVQQQLKKRGEGNQFDVGAKVSEYGQGVLEFVVGSVKNIVEIVLLPVLAIYFSLDSKKLKHEFLALLPRGRREAARGIHWFNQIMYSYVVGQAFLCALAGVVVGVGLWAIGMDYSTTLGVLAGITRAIPIIGPILGGIPIILLALVTKGFYVALGVLIFFTFLHFAESKFIMPKIIGDRMELHPVTIIVVLLIGQEFGGLLGMFFGPPLAAVTRVVVRRYWLRRYHRPARHDDLRLPPVSSLPETVD